MTEVGEGVAIVAAYIAEDKKCEYEPPNTNWTCKLDGDGGRLANGLEAIGVPKPPTPTKIEDVSYTCWPAQAHHLIPWQALAKHQVTQWLAKTPPKKAGVPGKVIKDTDYNVDHGNNGKFMPDSMHLPGWKTASAAKKTELSKMVMGAAGIQLHQGRHTATKYGNAEAGYHTRVKEYLAKIDLLSLEHITVTQCKDCKDKIEDGKVPPRANTIRYLDKASERLEVDINLRRIFVSRRAADFDLGGGVTG